MDADRRAIEALDEVAAAAESVAEDARRLAVSARALSAQARSGSSIGALDARALDLAGSLVIGARKLLAVNRLLQTGIARSLLAEGYTTREVGRRFGISHQRVSVLVGPRRG